MRISDWSSDVCSSDLPDEDHATERVINARIGVAVSERAEQPLRDRGRILVEQIVDARAHREILQHIDRACKVEIAVSVDLAVDDIGRALEEFIVGVARQFGAAEIAPEIGRGSGREGGCQYGSISGVAGALKKK